MRAWWCCLCREIGDSVPFSSGACWSKHPGRGASERTSKQASKPRRAQLFAASGSAHVIRVWRVCRAKFRTFSDLELRTFYSRTSPRPLFVLFRDPDPRPKQSTWRPRRKPPRSTDSPPARARRPGARMSMSHRFKTDSRKCGTR